MRASAALLNRVVQGNRDARGPQKRIVAWRESPCKRSLAMGRYRLLTICD
jgi:hypothetical protein